jgi:GTP-binding protein
VTVAAAMPITVAIVGRPNVGKSTLFNRLVGRRLALVDDTPGVTRDRREAEASYGDLSFRVIDTAGLEVAGPETLEGRMRRQTEAAVAEADLILFVIDARVGVTPADQHFAQIVRASGRPVAVLANKAEGRAAESGILDAYSLGFGEPIPISAEHGIGMPTSMMSSATPRRRRPRATMSQTGAARLMMPKRNRFT